MKIKHKVQKTLPQLIEWAMENEIKDRMFLSKSYYVGFDRRGYIYIKGGVTIPLDRTFTVEVEEEITENSKLYLVERYISSYEGFKLKYRTHPNRSIKSILEYNQSHLKTTHIYAEVNNELALIWTKEEGLIS